MSVVVEFICGVRVDPGFKSGGSSGSLGEVVIGKNYGDGYGYEEEGKVNFE